MKKAIVVFLLLSTPALAQQQSSDPSLNACQQLLSGANNNLIQVAAQAIVLNKQLEEVKAELAKLKEEKK